MFKAAALTVLLSFSIQAQATTAIFSTIKAAIVLHDDINDANALFDAMNTAVVDAPPNSVKKFLSFNQSSGMPYFDVSCSRNKDSNENAACIVNVYRTSFARINASAKTIHMTVSGQESWHLSGGFYLNSADGRILESGDQKLNIYVKDAGLNTQEFHISYK